MNQKRSGSQSKEKEDRVGFENVHGRSGQVWESEKASLRVRDGVRVKKILVLNVNFWQLKKSYLRLKLKSENLGSA